MLLQAVAKVGGQIDAKELKAIMQGPSERDIVYSGLEDTMATAVAETIATATKMNVNYRTAAFVNAVQKIAAVYATGGLTM